MYDYIINWSYYIYILYLVILSYYSGNFKAFLLMYHLKLSNYYFSFSYIFRILTYEIIVRKYILCYVLL